jgi:hypothetical protein
MKDEAFFVGWSGRTGRALGGFLALVAMLVTGGFLAVGYALSAGGEDGASSMMGLAAAPRVVPDLPEPGRFTGVLDRGPYPLLRLDPTAARPQGETLLMSLWDKRGVPVRDDLYGLRVSVEGVVFRRGDVSMLLSGGDFAPAEGPAAPAPTAEPLGRWRIAGEICDGKCYAGVMAPGDGLAHRACAAMCFVGDVPMVFVAEAPVAGTRFFVLADAQGATPSSGARGLVGLPVTLEGRLERRGSIVVFAADLDRAVLR